MHGCSYKPMCKRGMTNGREGGGGGGGGGMLDPIRQRPLVKLYNYNNPYRKCIAR